MCVVEYAKDEKGATSDLWAYADTLSEAYSVFEFGETRVSARNIEFKTVDGVLQMTFDLEVYVKQIDETELMEELDFSIK